MTDPSCPVSGARLDELEAITLEYAGLTENALGLSGVGLAVWIALAELASRVDGSLGAIAYAACAPVCLGMLLIQVRRASRLGVVLAKPASAPVRGRLGNWLAPFLTTGIIVNLFIHWTGGKASGLLAIALTFVVIFGLVVTPLLAARFDTYGQRAGLVSIALMISMMHGAVEQGLVGSGVVFLVALVLAAGFTGIALGERRTLRRLEARLAFLRDHTR
jgi:hypothetical protein